MSGGIRITGPFTVENGKVVRDEKAEEAKLPVCARIARRSSKRVRVARRGEVSTRHEKKGTKMQSWDIALSDGRVIHLTTDANLHPRLTALAQEVIDAWDTQRRSGWPKNMNIRDVIMRGLGRQRARRLFREVCTLLTGKPDIANIDGRPLSSADFQAMSTRDREQVAADLIGLIFETIEPSERV